jgi:N utilization substance protein A
VQAVVQELRGEKIDIVPFDEDPARFVCSALLPAEVSRVIIDEANHAMEIIVPDDQLSLAIGRRGQNVRLASKLCGWDIEIMTREELDESIERAVGGFSALEGVDDGLAEKLVGEGFLSFDDLEVIEPDALMEMGGLTEEQTNLIVAQAEVKAREAEQAAAIERRRQREQDRIDVATAAAEAAEREEVEKRAAAEAAEREDAEKRAAANGAEASPPTAEGGEKSPPEPAPENPAGESAAE